MSAEKLVVELQRCNAGAVSEVGGKAANLGELITAGFPVPPGFVVTTAAYAEVAKGRLDDLGPEQMRVALLDAPIPAAVADAVRRSYAGLGTDVAVAVRSSATAEDLPWASFAGQQDTFLGILGADAVLDAVRRCWASLWTDRATSYRTAQGIGHASVQLAVVVQQMVDARMAGVLFTADPVTGRRTRTMIDASPGLGEAVVSGAVNPEHIVVEGERTIVEHRAGDRTVEIRQRSGGGTEYVVSEGEDRPSLDEKQIAALVDLGRRVEAHFGAPQDIEWALDADGTTWLTQSRPITTLHPLPTPAGDGLRVYFCFSLAQGLTQPITPMGLAALRVISAMVSEKVFGVPVPSPVAGAIAFRPAALRAFADITPAVRTDIGRAIVPRVLDVMESRSAVVLRSLFDDPRLVVRRASRARFAWRLLRALLRFRVPAVVALALVSPAAGRRHADRIGARVRAITAAPVPASPSTRLDLAVRVLREGFAVVPRVAPVAGAGFIALQVARSLAREELAGGVHDLLRSLPHNSTTEMDLELWQLATRLRADPEASAALRETGPVELAHRFRAAALPLALQDGLARFLAQHGHRAVAEIDLGLPRWSEDPAYVLGVLANYLRLDRAEPAPDAVFARGAQAADGAVATVVERVRRRSRWRSLAVRFALRRVRELAGMRETHKDYLIRILAHAREQLAAVGVELTGRGLLDDPSDVFFLDLTEAHTALAGTDHRAVVAARRDEYERELRRRHVPRVLLSDGTEPEALAAGTGAPTGGEGALVGTAASAGTVTARARVVLDPVGAHLEPGEVLVVPSTDPGWTPLFLTAGGLVMEMGGPNSHGAVVAREYGIPAVVGVPNATSRIETGQLVTVDGAAGIVRLTESEEPTSVPA